MNPVSFDTLIEKLDIPKEIPGSLEASYDSAVSQFRNHCNAVGFLPILSCPAATWGKGGCGPVCYARHGRGQMPAVVRRLTRNTHVLMTLCRRGDVKGLIREFLRLMDQAEQQHDRRLGKEAQKPHSPRYRHLKLRGPLFRFQWAGDLIHPVHARAIRASCGKRSQQTCWLYTRSFHLLEHLEPVPANLTVWLSEDVQNTRKAQEAHRRFPWTRIAHMKEGQAGIVCPKYRYLETAQACARCGICFDSTAPEIVFPIKTFLGGEKSNPLAGKPIPLSGACISGTNHQTEERLHGTQNQTHRCVDRGGIGYRRGGGEIYG